MPTKRSKQTGGHRRPLAAPVDAAKSALDRADNVAGEVVDNVAGLTEPVRDLAASVIEILSPTAARTIHPERRRGEETPSRRPARKRVAQAANKTSAAASRVADQAAGAADSAARQAGKGASRAVKAANRAVDRAQSAASRAVNPSGGKKKKR